MVALAIGSGLILGALQFFKTVATKSKNTLETSTLDTELSRFEQIMTTDLARAGNDATGNALWAFQYKIGQTCAAKQFDYGLVMYPSDKTCENILGQIGIISYQGSDINHDGVFFPEEGLKMNLPSLRPPAPVGVVPTPPNPLPVNFYNDYIVYMWDAPQDLLKSTLVRKNIGDPNTTQDDTDEVVLRNVVYFSVDFQVLDNLSGPDDGTSYSKVTVTTVIRVPFADPAYSNPAYPSPSPFTHYHTQSLKFSFSVIQNASAIY